MLYLAQLTSLSPASLRLAIIGLSELYVQDSQGMSTKRLRTLRKDLIINRLLSEYMHANPYKMASLKARM